AVRAVDPDRIIVPISGNMKDWGNAYDQPPGLAISPEYWSNTVDDFHNYYGWYNQAGQVWKFSKRRLQAARMVTVGEFGFEGLDSYATMSQQYPPHFKPTPAIGADALFGNVQVQKADVRQLEGFRGEKPSN